MIICRTPFRLSFFGGGTDFPAWYLKHGGSVVATTIDKYCQLSCRFMPPFFEHRFRVVWSKIETCSNIEQVTHSAVRTIVRELGLDERCLEIQHIGDLPARSGMGSSSAFTVGLLHALSALQGKMISKHDLARESIRLEQDVLREAVGSQDQVSAAYGGFNRIDFLQNGEISVVPITLSRDKINELNSHLMLFYTGIKRTSSDVQQKFVHDMEDKKRQLRIMRDLVDESISILNGNQDIIAFGDLLREAWDIKRSFSKSVSNPEVDAMYDAARSAGAVGGKVTGAGGGGFLLLFVPPEKQERVRQALSKLLYVPFKFEFSGSQVVYASADADYIDVEQVRATQKLQAFKENTEIILSESDPDYRSLKQELPTEEVDRISEKVRGILTGSEKASVAEQK